MLRNFNGFVLGTQTACTKLKLKGVTVNIESHGMDVRLPVTASVPLGMTDVMTELWCFTT